jgi:hypothetical protein
MHRSAASWCRCACRGAGRDEGAGEYSVARTGENSRRYRSRANDTAPRSHVALLSGQTVTSSTLVTEVMSENRASLPLIWGDIYWHVDHIARVMAQRLTPGHSLCKGRECCSVHDGLRQVMEHTIVVDPRDTFVHPGPTSVISHHGRRAHLTPSSRSLRSPGCNGGVIPGQVCDLGGIASYGPSPPPEGRLPSTPE